MKTIKFICFISFLIIGCNPSEIRTSAVSITNSLKNDIVSSTTNTLQNRKDEVLQNKPENQVAIVCLGCQGSGKDKSDICKNCIDWNAEYRSKVACDLCHDSRKIEDYDIPCTYCENNSGVQYQQKDLWDKLEVKVWFGQPMVLIKY
jgi:hypothetical protein